MKDKIIKIDIQYYNLGIYTNISSKLNMYGTNSSLARTLKT